MKVYSYTSKNFPRPGMINQRWPVPFLEGYAAFIENFEKGSYLLLEDESSGICLPLQVKTTKIFRIGQILFAPTKGGTPATAEEQKSFFEKMLIFLKKENICHRLQQPHPVGMTAAYPEAADWCRFGTYLNDLQEGDDEALLQTFDPKYRKAVQHSIKNGGRVAFGPEVLDDFYKLYKATTTRAGIYTDSMDYFRTQLNWLGDNADLGVVYDENGPVGSIFTLWSGHHSLCTHAGSGGESKLYGAMKHLHYAMMLRMKGRGVKWYDLVGVRLNSDHPSLQGVFRFKKGFGGILHEGYLWKKDLSPLPMQLFDLLIKIKSRGKTHADIIDQENATVKPATVILDTQESENQSA
jgi:hypothetical protein